MDAYVQIYDSPFHCLIDIKTGKVNNPAKPISIGKNVWIGNHATITAGAYIPDFFIVASHSLVNKRFETHCIGILIGMPAKYKEFGKVRLLNCDIENTLKIEYFSKKRLECINIKDLGYEIFPLDGDKNTLFHR